MKKFFIAILIITTMLFSSACSSNSDKAKENTEPTTQVTTENLSTLTGTSTEILDKLLADANEQMGEDKQLPATMTADVTANDSKGNLGLSKEQFTDYIDNASVATALIGTFAFETAIVKAKDIEKATLTKKAISEGFDPQKWICVRPERCLVVESGEYILFVAATTEQATAILKVFETETKSSLGEVNTFYEFEKDI